MPKEYIFKYIGSKESFLAILNSFPNNKKLYFIDEYMIEVFDSEIRFGVERAGHAGGNWFVSKFTEESNQIEFRGKIQYIGPASNRTKRQKALDKLEEILLYILLFPLVVVFFVISKILWIIRKIRKQPNPKNTEEKLLHLMENHLKCQRVNVNSKSYPTP